MAVVGTMIAVWQVVNEKPSVLPLLIPVAVMFLLYQLLVSRQDTVKAGLVF